MTYDSWIFDHPANHEPDPVGQQDGETCGRYPEPDDEAPRGYKPKPCKGVMVAPDDWEVAICDTCGEIGE